MMPPGYSGVDKFKILCVEDDPSNRDLIEQLLTEVAETELLTAKTGRAALALARSKLPNLILLDLNLPDMSGIEVFHALKASAISRRIPVIVISAETSSQQIERLLIKGVDEYITKPIDVDAFFRAIEAVKSRQ